MSIEVNKLTKYYGTQQALKEVSFSVKPGEIVGFLGPNGAGKSTCMKILTSYIPMDSGSAKIAGLDVDLDALSLKKKVGYLPEQNPLYLDMYVKEFLSFVGRIHQVNDLQQRVSEMIDMTGLNLEAAKKIRSLSKGYKQRVGLAQAMIHNPDVLILDEPTAGLDPNQLSEIRQLIQEFGREKTVLFSSHIMQEVQAICDRVIIINKGKIVADDQISLLSQSRNSEETIRVKIKEVISAEAFKGMKSLEKVSQKGEFFDLTFSENQNGAEIVFQWVNDKNWTVLHLQQVESSLEDIFHVLTKES